MDRKKGKRKAAVNNSLVSDDFPAKGIKIKACFKLSW